MRLLVNLNDTVRVRLTEAGRKVYCEHWAPHVRTAGMNVPDWIAEKLHRPVLAIQIHELMHVFGPHATVGAEPLFESNDLELRTNA